MNAGPGPSVAHCVTPYLFLTGSWIHAQLVHARRHRPIVLTQGVANLETFPFAPVHDLSARGAASLFAARISKYLLGRFPSAPYARAVKTEGVRLLHAHQGWEGARLVHTAGRLGLPLVVSFYGRDATLLPRNPYWRRLYRPLFARADRIVAEGSAMARTLEQIGAPRERIRVIHLGVDPADYRFRERRPPEDDAPIVGLLAASFREKKGIPYALDAFAHVASRHPRLRLRIIGDGPLRGALEAQIVRLGIGSRIDLLGYQPFPRYREELDRAHFLLAPSVVANDGDSEGGAPVCLLDAQAVGLPVVATRHCDIPEVTLPGRSALLAEERDVQGLAACLDALLGTPERWEEMGRAGRAHVEAEFDITRQVDRMADLYDEVLTGR